jgi:hypothetical protein
MNHIKNLAIALIGMLAAITAALTATIAISNIQQTAAAAPYPRKPNSSNNNNNKKKAIALSLFIVAISFLLLVPSLSSSKMIVAYSQDRALTNKTNTNTAHHNFTTTVITTKGRIVKNNKNIIIAGATDPVMCTPDLKRFVVHLFNETFHGKPILKILAPCVTVTGTVIGNTSSRIPHIREQADKDLIINLLPDAQFKSLISPANTRFAGAIHVEAICQGNNLNTKTGLGHHVPHLHVGDCKGYNGPHFPIPKVGDRLKITGVYAQDIYEGGHTEIHPVNKIEFIGTSPHFPLPTPYTTVHNNNND